MLTLLKYLLFPISVLYGIVVGCRNKLYDLKIFSSHFVKTKTICIGNISLGGTGKTPHTEYVAKLLQQLEIPTAILSRGYGRKSTGFLEVTKHSTALQVGDEPLQMRHNLPAFIPNFVCENRIEGISTIIANNKTIQCVLLDDAFQHRQLNSGFNILLTDYNCLFYNDYFLPTGTLRDSKQSVRRANLIIVTKCPELIDKNAISKNIQKYSDATILYSKISYTNKLIHLISDERLAIDAIKDAKVILITGISNPKLFYTYISSIASIIKHYNFNDHHNFSVTEFENIIAYYTSLSDKVIIITTQKDAMRLKENITTEALKKIPFFYLPIEITFEQNDTLQLKQLITEYVTTN